MAGYNTVQPSKGRQGHGTVSAEKFGLNFILFFGHPFSDYFFQPKIYSAVIDLTSVMLMKLIVTENIF